MRLAPPRTLLATALIAVAVPGCAGDETEKAARDGAQAESQPAVEGPAATKAPDKATKPRADRAEKTRRKRDRPTRDGGEASAKPTGDDIASTLLGLGQTKKKSAPPSRETREIRNLIDRVLDSGNSKPKRDSNLPPEIERLLLEQTTQPAP